MSFFVKFNQTAYLLAPYLGLRPTQIFPISLESAPFLFSIWFGLCTFCYYGFIKDTINVHKDDNFGKKRRRDETFKNMRNLVFLENARLAKQHVDSNSLNYSKNKPPNASSVLKVIFDNVIEESVSSALDIPAENPWYLRAGRSISNNVACS